MVVFPLAQFSHQKGTVTVTHWLGMGCVLKTSSVLIGPANRLNVSGDGRAALLRPGRFGLSIQVEEPA